MEMNYLKEKQKMSIALIVSCAAVVLSLLGSRRIVSGDGVLSA